MERHLISRQDEVVIAESNARCKLGPISTSDLEEVSAFRGLIEQG